ncbi:MAG: PAS domain S-box protein, partial [Actinomycetota bacterium]|nr:PAS domain S-box protein [Actinomycetota bacterium]
IFSNLPGAEMLGYEPEELVGLPLHEIVHHTRADGSPYPLEECAIQAAFQDGKTHRVVDEVFWKKDGTSFPVEYVSTPTRENGEVSGAVVTFQDITERKRAEEAVFEIREAERRRIARDLHDIALQDLVGVLQSIQASRVELKDPQSSVNLEPEIKALQTAIQGLRNAIHDLRAEEEQDFEEAVEALVELNRQLAPERRIELDLVEDGSRLRELPGVVGTELLRVIQEALVNVRRHARARRVEVTVGVAGDEVWAEVADDGRGFDPEIVRKGVGLSGMQERIVALGGEMKVESEVGKGTRMTARLPTHEP